VLEITLLVVSLALVDSVNPVTIAVALYLGSDERPHSRVAGFAADLQVGLQAQRVVSRDLRLGETRSASVVSKPKEFAMDT